MGSSPRRAASVELDHVFILVSPGAPEGERLRRAGVPEGTPNRHPGQGTACRRFVLKNAYIELLWVSDPDEAQSAAVRPTQLWDRWAGRHDTACPFGVVLRSTGEGLAAPFDSWEYRPPYLPPPLAIHAARDVPLTEPAFFHLGFQREPAPITTVSPDAGLGAATITKVAIAAPRAATSAAARDVAAGGWFATIGSAPAFLMTLTLDDGQRRVTEDLRPDLPLVLEW